MDNRSIVTNPHVLFMENGKLIIYVTHKTILFMATAMGVSQV
jgi:hypothetical protein